MEELEFLLDTEFNNAGELLGFDAGSSGQLGATLARMNPLQRVKVMQKLIRPQHPSRKSRGEMEKFFKELPEHIKKELQRGKLRLADFTAYSIKPIGSSKTVKLFETQDDKEIGITNISNAKLPKNQSLLVSGIYLLAGVAPQDPNASEKDLMKSTNFVEISSIPALTNGEFSLVSNKVQIVPETANRVFVNGDFSPTKLGYYKLDNPRLIQDDVEIEFTIELGTVYNIPAGAHVWVGLEGTITTP